MVFSRTTLPRPLPSVARALVLCATCAAGPALAQGIASNADEPRAGEVTKGSAHVIDINEIERGFFVSVDYGPNYFIPLNQPGFVNINPDGTLPGTRMGIRVGYDILNNIELDAFVLANFNEGLLDQSAIKAGALSGDLSHFAPGVAVRFDYITTDRFFAFARVGAGYALWFPKQLAGGATGSVHTDASLGVEYYTKLRHLSIGLEGDFQALIAPFAFGVEVYPTLKYTF